MAVPHRRHRGGATQLRHLEEKRSPRRTRLLLGGGAGAATLLVILLVALPGAASEEKTAAVAPGPVSGQAWYEVALDLETAAPARELLGATPRNAALLEELERRDMDPAGFQQRARYELSRHVSRGPAAGPRPPLIEAEGVALNADAPEGPAQDGPRERTDDPAVDLLDRLISSLPAREAIEAEDLR